MFEVARPRYYLFLKKGGRRIQTLERDLTSMSSGEGLPHSSALSLTVENIHGVSFSAPIPQKRKKLECPLCLYGCRTKTSVLSRNSPMHEFDGT